MSETEPQPNESNLKSSGQYPHKSSFNSEQEQTEITLENPEQDSTVSSVTKFENQETEEQLENVSLEEWDTNKEPVQDIVEGMSPLLAAFFVAGVISGSGIVALPYTLKQIGWFGVLVIIICGCNALYSGMTLGACWTILEERWPIYKEFIRDPYPAIAYRAGGTVMKYILHISLNITLFGVCVVFLLLASEIFQEVFDSFSKLSFCIWILILALLLCPLTWLGTPQDFWLVAIVSYGSTICLALLLIVAMFLHGGDNFGDETKRTDHTISSFALAFGTILFAFGGVSVFPTVQNDMDDKKRFNISAFLGYIMGLCVYLPVAIVGYAIYGENVERNALRMVYNSPNKTARGFSIAANVFLAIHLWFTFIIIMNPAVQDFEKFLKVPPKFCLQRCLVRIAFMGLVVIAALTLPDFSRIVNLIGASTITLMTFVLPPVCYLLLLKQKNEKWPERKYSYLKLAILIEIIILGIIGGCISTYESISAIVKSTNFFPPCYVSQ